MAAADRVRVLVVEGDARYARVLTELLAADVEIECCGSGAEAGARLRARPFDWMLLDLGLRDADGLALTRAFRREFPATRVLLHTATALADDRRRALEAGAVDLLEKPFSLSYLRGLLGS
jgi:CheY-like chemotaxis protein